MQIEQVNGTLSLIDDRNSSLGGWIIVRSIIPEAVAQGALEWVITPNLLSGWIRKPVISLSQVGFHPELKEPYPYIWQQTEYVMPGAASYIFCVLAADHLLNMQ
jgi:hypothetical protein